VPRTTLRHWAERKASIDAEPELVAFFESNAGVALLHRLVTAAHVVFGLVGCSGARQVGLFLKHAGVAPFVATSRGAQQKIARSVNQQVANFDVEQREALSAKMRPKDISVCLDETFHESVCLVGIEPVSNFILLEDYVQRRDAPTWKEAMRQAMKDLPVNVLQCASDEGRALLSYVHGELGVHHDRATIISLRS
jgi:hypothetical protein